MAAAGNKLVHDADARADEFVLGPAAEFGEFNAINRQSRVFRVTIPVHPYEIVSVRVEFAHSHSSHP
jgi:hypothetical protein